MSRIILLKRYVRKEGIVQMKDILNGDISLEKKREIEEVVNKILDENNIGREAKESSLIVDIVRLVKSHDFAVQSADMDIDTTGCLMVNEHGRVLDSKKNKLILVNANFTNENHDENVVLKKSRFITAHEYGHYVLHKEEKEPFYAHRDSRHRTEPMELEADYFARSILMPLDVFKKYVTALKNLKIFDDHELAVSVLSTIFKVTKNKVQKRLNDIEQLG